MTTLDELFHETWMGMVQPIEGLVVSTPVLLEADVAARKPAAFHERFKAHVRHDKRKKKDVAAADDDGGDRAAPVLADVRAFFADLLEIGDDLRVDALPKELSATLAEGNETITPSWAIRASGAEASGYQLLAWELPAEVDLDRTDTREGAWAYPPRAKFDRLLRQTGVPIGLLTNGRVLRLVYAPAGESSGAISFRVADMEKVEGRPILDAVVMLLHARRFEGAGEGRSLAHLLAKSRRVQAEVSKDLEAQVRAALERLLRGFEEAAERDGRVLLDEAHADGTLTHGLLTLLLRIVFVLFAEDRELLPMEHSAYREGLSVLGLFERLQADAASYPDSMGRRFGAYGRLVALFRTIFLGVHHKDLVMPPRHGDLFDPHRFPFLEGWGPAGGAPITLPEDRAKVRVPSVDDGCIFEVLHKLLYLRRERLSYRALDVEQIGSVYEGLMAFDVARLASPAVRLGPYDVWVEAAELVAEKPASRAKWLKEKTDLAAGKCEAIADAVEDARHEADVFVALLTFVKDAEDRASAGRFVLQPGADRKHTSSHYTPRSLSEPIVKKTLRPLLAAMGDAPDAERILSLKVCDPAMGSGAFLVAACRFLGAEVVAAWTRSGEVAKIAREKTDVVTHARRLVAQRCLYGVDKNPFAVSLGKLSLWLATLAKDEPFTFIDHALRCGDSLVGLSFEQIEKFTWEPVAPAKDKKGQLTLNLFQDEIAYALNDALAARKRIEALADDASLASLNEKERLLDDATDALASVRLIGDLVVGAFFAHDKAKEREAERELREQKVRAWLGAGGPVPDDLRAIVTETREKQRPLHWPVEFPEIFFAERPDPLEPDAPSVAYVDAFVGNPPFLGGTNISPAFGERYLAWLQNLHPGTHGNADLVTHFFRRTNVLLGKHGTIGLIATKTIAQGDTRTSGLQPLLRDGLRICDATKLMPWPGDAANVSVSVVHLVKGNAINAIATCMLDGVEVPGINSRLRAGEERPDPARLVENIGKSFQGSKIYGQGFILTPDERNALVTKDPRNAQRIFGYLGGDEVNTSPTQSFDRYVINFGQMSLDEAGEWPELLNIVREKVKPERDANKREVRRKYWWRFGEVAPGLHKAIASMRRCLVTGQVSKHSMFSFQPVDRVYSQKLIVFPLDGLGPFAVLQSRVHEGWARLLSSSLEDRLSYAPSDCFETFPFPPPSALATLEPSGQNFYDARARYLADENVGLTIAHNRMKDSAVADPRIEELRALAMAMDSAVLAAYGWSDLIPPPFTIPESDGDKRTLSIFEDAVIDRLFALNAERAKAQRGAGARHSNDNDESATLDINAAKRGRTTTKKTSAEKKKPV